MKNLNLFENDGAFVKFTITAPTIKEIKKEVKNYLKSVLPDYPNIVFGEIKGNNILIYLSSLPTNYGSYNSIVKLRVHQEIETETNTEIESYFGFIEICKTLLKLPVVFTNAVKDVGITSNGVYVNPTLCDVGSWQADEQDLVSKETPHKSWGNPNSIEKVIIKYDNSEVLETRYIWIKKATKVISIMQSQTIWEK